MLRATDVRNAACRWSGGQFGQAGCNVFNGDRLQWDRWSQQDREEALGAEHLVDEVVELGSAEYGVRDRRLGDQLLAVDFVAVVPQGDAVDADDRHQDQVLHAGRPHGLDELPGLIDVAAALAGGQMEHCVDAVECRAEALAGGQIGRGQARSAAAAQDPDVVAAWRGVWSRSGGRVCRFRR